LSKAVQNALAQIVTKLENSTGLRGVSADHLGDKLRLSYGDDLLYVADSVPKLDAWVAAFLAGWSLRGQSAQKDVEAKAVEAVDEFTVEKLAELPAAARCWTSLQAILDALPPDKEVIFRRRRQPDGNIEPATSWRCPKCKRLHVVGSYELAEIGTPHCPNCNDGTEMEPDETI
jgi:hypothetical protein